MCQFLIEQLVLEDIADSNLPNLARHSYLLVAFLVMAVRAIQAILEELARRRALCIDVLHLLVNRGNVELVPKDDFVRALLREIGRVLANGRKPLLLFSLALLLVLWFALLGLRV